MSDTGKQKQKAKEPLDNTDHSIIRQYWWLFIIAVVLLAATILLLTSNRQDPSLDLTEVVVKDFPNEPESEANMPLIAMANESNVIGELDLPLPEDVNAIARYHSTEGKKKFSDATVLWQKRQDNYIDFLHEESFEDGLNRSYMNMELVFALGNFPNSNPSYLYHITLQARTKRFAKLLAYVRQAKKDGNIVKTIDVIDAAVKRFTESRLQTVETLERLMEEEPEIFRTDTPEKERRKFKRLVFGHGVTLLNVPEGVIPMSLRGTQLGTVVATFLLGYAEHPKTVKTLLDIVSYDDDPLIDKLANAIGLDENFVEAALRHDLTFENRVVMADALDRTMMSCLRDSNVNSEALLVAKQYSQWRQEQDFPDRQFVEVVAYDSPKTPYHLPGSITGVKSDEITESAPLELPLELKVPGTRGKPNEEIIEPIIEFARRFNEAFEDEAQ
ncbi:MAG: hypothetical protein ACYSWP_15995 [Planctomycetota bacterium]|jgi:hypothetical protein